MNCDIKPHDLLGQLSLLSCLSWILIKLTQLIIFELSELPEY